MTLPVWEGGVGGGGGCVGCAVGDDCGAFVADGERIGEREVDLRGPGGVLDLADVADHQANGSNPPKESGRPVDGEDDASRVRGFDAKLPGSSSAGGCAWKLPATSEVVSCEDAGDVTMGRCPVTIGGNNCHFSEEVSASSNQLTVGGSGFWASCRKWPVREAEDCAAACITLSM